MENQNTHPWTAKDDAILIANWNNKNIKHKDLAKSMGFSITAIKRHAAILKRDNRIPTFQKSRVENGKRSYLRCDGDCDHCIYPDCYVSDSWACRMQKKQDDERYSKLPACDRRVIDFRKAQHLILETEKKRGRRQAYEH